MCFWMFDICNVVNMCKEHLLQYILSFRPQLLMNKDLACHRDKKILYQTHQESSIHRLHVALNVLQHNIQFRV